MSELRTEVVKLKVSLAAKDTYLTSLHNELLKLSKAQKDLSEPQAANSMLPQQHVYSSSRPNLNADTAAQKDIISESPRTSLADVAKALQMAPDKPFQETTNTRRQISICGKSQRTSSMAVEGVRRINVFVSRLLPNVTEHEIVNLVKDTFPSCTSVTAEKLQTRFDSYASFHVELFVARSGFDDVIQSMYSDENWPAGVLIRRFFRNTKQHGTQG